MGLTKGLKLEYELVFELYVGLYGCLEITSFLTNRKILIFCRLFGWQRTGFNNGHACSRRISGSLWTMAAISFLRLLKISIFRLLGGGILVDCKMNSFVILFIFRWLIFVSTLSNP